MKGIKNSIVFSALVGLAGGLFFALPAGEAGQAGSGNECPDTLLVEAVSEDEGSKSQPSEVERRRVFKRRGRRDPFIPALIPKDKKTIRLKIDNNSQERYNQSSNREKALEDLSKAQKYLDQMKQIAREFPDPEKNKALSKPYQKILEIHEALNKTNYESIKAQTENIRQEAEKLFPGTEMVYFQAKYLHEQAGQNFATGKFSPLAENLNKIKLLPESIEVIGTDYQAQIQALVEEVNQLTQRAGVIQDFYSKNLKISGIFYYRPIERISLPPCQMRFFGLELDIPLTYSREISASTAIINNSVYEEGASLEEGLTIKKIEPGSVLFVYKGEEVNKGLGRK